MPNRNGTDWATEYQAASRVTDLAQDPDDFRVTRQSKVTIGGLLVPVSEKDDDLLTQLAEMYMTAFDCYYQASHSPRSALARCAAPNFRRLSGTMQAMMKRAAARAAESPPDLDYISIDPRDYTIFTAPSVPVPVVCIHTRPERCWFLGVMRFEGALGLSLGRMRVMRPTDQGVYPVTIRTKWRALTNKIKQEEVRDAYQRLIHAS